MNAKRGFWLTSLIIGATIFVWLTLLGIVVSGTIIVIELAKSDNNSTNQPYDPSSSCIYTATCD